METKHQAISRQILDLIASGLTAQQALDKVCGEGTWKKMVGDLYDALRAKQGVV